MKRWGQFIGLLALVVFLLPALTAQEKDKAKDPEKKAKAKDEKKDPDKKDADKKDPDKKGAEKDKKDPDKKEPEKKDEKVVYGQVLYGVKLSKLEGSTDGFAVDLPFPDPEKIAQVNEWKLRRAFEISRVADPNQRFQQMAQFQQELAGKQVYSMKPVDMKFAENLKVRTGFLPLVYDDEGKPKKWTPKAIAQFKGKTTLPGFPAAKEDIKLNSFVDVYLAKKSSVATSKGPPEKKAKGKKKDDDDLPVIQERPEAVMIVIRAEPMR